MLLERAVANLIDNALFFSPWNVPVRVEAADVGGTLHLTGDRRRPGHPACGSRARVPAVPTARRQSERRRCRSRVGRREGFRERRRRRARDRGHARRRDDDGHHDPDRRLVTRLLLIDDEAPFVRAMGVSLRAMGYDVDAAPSGAAGLAKAATTTPDVIVLDLGLPDMDGLEVLNGLRAWTAVPVIVLSARDRDEAKVAALDGGADDYVTKPFSMDELLARIRAALRRRPGAVERGARRGHRRLPHRHGGEGGDRRAARPSASRRRSGTCSRSSSATRASSCRSGSC